MSPSSLVTMKKPEEPDVTESMALEHGLSHDEYALLVDHLGRVPNFTELGIVSSMWSEHCSYKTSRRHLKKFPTTGPQVIQGPGENAGVIDIGDGQAAIFKMESHNHPSFIEPYQGAATGVGGIMRDVFTMGGRPIASLNALRFGSPDHPKTRYLLSGVVAGISGYGNCMGVPTVGGELNFDPAYNGNILVNAMNVGIAEQDKIFYSAAAGIGNPVVYVGAKTGRDGIHGATMSSTGFSDETEAKRPTVQVGDPFTEKLLLEACMELMAGDAIIAIQDMGAAGLTSSSVEMASKGGVGIEINLDHVPQREQHMIPYELMLSESQERMLMVLRPGKEDEARAVFEKWELDFAVIGTITEGNHLVVKMHGAVAADLPLPILVEDAPNYDRPYTATPAPAALDISQYETPRHKLEILHDLISTPDLCSRRWISEQYDTLVMGNTVYGPSVGNARAADAAIVRIGDGVKALAMTTDCTPRYCYADPVQGGRQTVAEAWRNITSTGATPLAVTDNLNFGNPTDPEIMGQIVGCIEGMADACAALDFPVVSGNVSMYNETKGTSILPTPVIGGVGVIADANDAMSYDFKQEGESIILIGEAGSHLGQSLYLREIHGLSGRDAGAPPPVDLEKERKHGDFIRDLIAKKKITACHDISDGGLLVAIAEMALAGNIGAMLHAAPKDSMKATWWFGEDQARYVVTAHSGQAILQLAQSAGIPAMKIGLTEGHALNIIAQDHTLSLHKLRERYEGWLPQYMSENVQIHDDGTAT